MIKSDFKITLKVILSVKHAFKIKYSKNKYYLIILKVQKKYYCDRFSNFWTPNVFENILINLKKTFNKKKISLQRDPRNYLIFLFFVFPMLLIKIN